MLLYFRNIEKNAPSFITSTIKSSKSDICFEIKKCFFPILFLYNIEDYQYNPNYLFNYINDPSLSFFEKKQIKENILKISNYDEIIINNHNSIIVEVPIYKEYCEQFIITKDTKEWKIIDIISSIITIYTSPLNYSEINDLVNILNKDLNFNKLSSKDSIDLFDSLFNISIEKNQEFNLFQTLTFLSKKSLLETFNNKLYSLNTLLIQEYQSSQNPPILRFLST